MQDVATGIRRDRITLWNNKKRLQDERENLCREVNNDVRIRVLATKYERGNNNESRRSENAVCV